MWSIFPYENHFIDITREEINGIPCLRFAPKGQGGPYPTMINYHGWHSSKDFKRFESMTIASHGYQVIVPDALYHGDRGAIDHDNPQNLERFLWDIILQSVKESGGFIEEIINRYQADPEHIGIMGDSMGAITAGGVFAVNPGLKCLIGLNGAFAWQEAINRKNLPDAGQQNLELIKHCDLMNNQDKLRERALLMLHGTEDTSVSVDNQRYFYNKIQPLYTKHPERLSLMEASGVNHRTTTGMLERAIIWLKENL